MIRKLIVLENWFQIVTFADLLRIDHNRLHPTTQKLNKDL